MPDIPLHLSEKSQPVEEASGPGGALGTRSSPFKKAKVTRSKTACLQCRSKRSRCGAVPPDTCASCVEAGTTCQWPAPESYRKRGRRPQGHGSAETRTPTSSMEESPQNANTYNESSLRGTMAWAPTLHAQLSAPPLSSHVPQQPHLPHTTHRDIFNTFSHTSAGVQHRFENSIPGFFASEEYRFSPARPPVMEPPQPSTSPTSQTHTLQNPDWWASVPEQVEPGLLPLPVAVPTSEPVVRHLLELFRAHFACQFPFLTHPSQNIMESILRDREPVFLFNAIAAVSARFSTHPDIALSGLKPEAYGKSFYDHALRLVGPSMTTVCRENIAAFVLLAMAAFGNDSALSARMMAQIAVRLAMEMGLHLKPDMNRSQRDCSLDRLLFWSVLMLDYSLCFGDERLTTIRPSEITQDLPQEEDVHPPDSTSSKEEEGPEGLRSPFPYAAQTMYGLGVLSNLLIGRSGQEDSSSLTEIRAAWSKIAEQYDALPLDMNWTAANLKWHYRAGSAPTYLSLHLWNFTIQAYRYLAGPLRLNGDFEPSGRVEEDFPLMTIQANSWLHCARFIGDMLVLSDVVDPKTYLAIPLVCHCFHVAARCFAKDMEAGNRASNPPGQLPSTPSDSSLRRQRKENPRKLFAAIAIENIATFKQGLSQLGRYWSGVHQVESDFDRHLAGIRRLDVVGVSEKIARIISLPRSADMTGWLGDRKAGDDGKSRQESLANGPTLSAASGDGPETVMTTTLGALGETLSASVPSLSSLRPLSSFWEDQGAMLDNFPDYPEELADVLRDLGVDI